MSKVVEGNLTTVGLGSVEYGDGIGGSTTVYNSTTASFDEWRKQWENHPGFRRTKHVQLPWDNFSNKKSMTNYYKGSISRFPTGSEWVFVKSTGLLTETYTGGTIRNEAAPDASLISEMNGALSNKLLAKIKEMDVNLLQAFGERKQTVALVATTASRLIDTVKYLKRGDLYHAAQALGQTTDGLGNVWKERWTRRYARNPRDAVASAWLELQYGWKPLLDDVYGSAAALAKAETRQRTTRAKVLHSISRDTSTETMNGLGGALKQVEKRTWKITGSMTGEWEIKNEFSHTLSTLGITNPALLAWELLPFSFVADWFIPIGNMLSNLDATNGIAWRRGTFNYLYHYHSDASLIGTTRGGWTYAGAAAASSWLHACQRQVIGMPTVALPRFKNPFSPEHALNAIALLNNIFKK